MAYFKFIFDLV